MARNEEKKPFTIMAGIGGNLYSDQVEAARKQKEEESWQRALQLGNMATQYKDPWAQLGFSLGTLLFNKGFGDGSGGRNNDGTKYGSAGSAASAAETPAIDAEFAGNVGYDASDPMGVNKLGYQGDYRDTLNWNPAPGGFGSPEYAQQNGINIQQDTIAPTDNGQGVQAQSTSFSVQPLADSVGLGSNKGIDSYQLPSLINSEFNPANADNYWKKRGLFRGLGIGGGY